jgi:hypothetical protein
LPWNATAGAVQAALGGIIGAGNLVVTGGPGPDSSFTISFQNQFAGKSIPNLAADGSGLSGTPNPVILVQTTAAGGIATQDPVQIISSPSTVAARNGNNARMRVIIDGSGLTGATGIVLGSSHSIIRGLILTGFDVGINELPVDGAGNPITGNLIQGNSIGDFFYYPVDPQTGSSQQGGAAVGFRFGAGNHEQGIILSGTNTTVGGVNPQEANIICGSGAEGILIQPGASGNQVLGNQIGVAGPSDNGLYAQDGNGGDGIQVVSSGTASDPLHIVFTSSGSFSGNVISANQGSGIHLIGVGTIRNLIQNNLIGVGPGGGYKFGTWNPGNEGDGVRLDDAGQNQIGGGTLALGNAISSNQGAGIRISGSSATGNVVSHNMIGLTADGTQVLGNTLDGVAVSSADNTIGPGNVIAENLRGIGVYGPGATRTLIDDNFIGTDGTGTDYGFGNAQEGVRIDNSPANTIRGNSSGSQVISGNRIGVAIVGAGSTANQVAGNLIGSDKTGLSDLSNKDVGIYLGAAGNTVGGDTAAGRNLISANHTGIQFDGAGATGNLVETNYIGTDLTGNGPLSNEVLGVLFTNAAGANTIGGFTADLGNKIAFHLQDGVRVQDGTGNSILSNSIWSNGRLGIDLVAAGDPPGGVTPDPVPPAPPVRPGPNNLQAYPVLSYVTSNGTLTHIHGTLYSQPATRFLIQFFTTATADASGFGQGQKRFGYTQVSTDGSGNAVIDVTLTTPFPAGSILSATATNNATGDTSEFSRDVSQSPSIQFTQPSLPIDESAGMAIVTVSRTLIAGTTTVNYATLAGGTAVPMVDYTPVSGTLTFGPGVSTLTFAVPIIDDNQLENTTETVNLALTTGTGGYADFQTTAVLRIVDNDLAASRIFYVTNTADSGTGSLRQAILDANATPGQDDIEFAIPASSATNLDVPVPGFDPVNQTWTIGLQTPLPAITDPVTIDGFTQAHFPIPFRYPNAVTTTQVLNVTGNPTGGSFTLSTQSPLALLTTGDLPYDSTASEVGLELVSIFGMKNVAVSGGPSNVAPLTISFIGDLQGQTLPLLVPDSHLSGGVDPAVSVTASVTLGAANSITSSPNTTDALSGNDARGRVIIDGSQIPGGATGFVLDTANSLLRGLIIDGFATAVSIPNPADVGNQIQGNSLGAYFVYPVDPASGNPLAAPNDAAVAGLGNSGQGIYVNASNTTIGGTDPQENNVIANSGLQGVLIDQAAQGVVVEGNQIGVIGPSANGRYARVPNRAEGVLVYGSSNLIGGPGGGSGNLISANQQSGVRISGSSATRNVIGANIIGLAPGGGYLFGTGNPGNGGDGIRIEDSSANQVGGPDSSWANVISSNHGNGVVIAGAGAIGNVVLNDLIGLTADGKATQGNTGDGVLITSPGTVVGPGNVISGNQRGVHVSGAAASEAVIKGNLIGTDASGSFDLGNSFEGVLIENATDASITGDGNGSQVISGNQQGVAVRGATSTRNLIAGNLIGSDKKGLAPIPNAAEGVWIQDSPGNSVGGTTAAGQNLISSNHWGLRLSGAGAVANLVEGNLIGTDISSQSPLGNEINGVIVTAGASNNTIGGTAGNTIAFNVAAGVSIESGTGNTILSNSIWSNGRLGIDLVAPGDPASGVTPNQPGIRSGPNNLQNAPVLTGAVGGGATGIIQGSLNSVPNATFTIQFFRNQVPDPSGFGQGRTLLGSTSVTTNANGDAAISYAPGTGLPASTWICATATNSATGDTSEFSNDVSAQPVTLEFASATWSVDVTAGSALIHVHRSGNLQAVVSVNYATGGGSAVAGKDYNPASGTLTFQVGQTDKTFPVTVLSNPGQTAASVNVNLSLSQPTGGSTLGLPSTSVLTISNNLPPILQFKTASYSASSTANSALVTVIRGGGSRSTPVQVHYSTAGGSAAAGVDYTPVSGTLTFLANQTTATFSVPIVPGSHPAGRVTVGLVLSNPTAGTQLGSPGAATLSITTSAVNPPGGSVGTPGGPIETTPPQVIGQQLLLGPTGVTGIVFTFSEALDATRANELANYGYFAITAGPDGQVGTADDGAIPLSGAWYDSASRAVTLQLSSPVPWNQFARITINALANPLLRRGLVDTSGNLLSGAGNGIPGGAYMSTFGVGTQLSYTDGAGKGVLLSLTGGGLIQVFRSAGGDPQSITLIGTTPRRSLLSLHADNRGGRFTYLPPIQGAAGVKLRYRTPPIVFRSSPVAPGTSLRARPAQSKRPR